MTHFLMILTALTVFTFGGASFAALPNDTPRQLVLKSKDQVYVFINFTQAWNPSGSNGACLDASFNQVIVVGNGTEELKSFRYFQGVYARPEKAECYKGVCSMDLAHYSETIRCVGPGFPINAKSNMPRVSFELNGKKLVDSIEGGTESFGLAF